MEVEETNVGGVGRLFQPWLQDSLSALMLRCSE